MIKHSSRKSEQSQEDQKYQFNEAPVIVKSINRGITSIEDDAKALAISRMDQVISNTEAYNMKYSSLKNYYDDKKMFVFDQNYKKMEDALIDSFEKSIRDVSNKNIISVDQIKNRIPIDVSSIPTVFLIIYTYSNFYRSQNIWLKQVWKMDHI